MPDAKAPTYIFSSGPAALPAECLRQAQQELLDWGGRGFSVMETSHRAEDFVAVMHETVQLLRELLRVPSNYRILLMQGGGHQQFAMVPVNLLGETGSADYIVSGHWSKLAFAEAQRLGRARCAADNAAAAAAARAVPLQRELALDPAAAYVYYCPNETINGLEFDYVPDTGRVPLVADASSNLLSRTIDVSRHGIIYACAQKNFGPSGLTAVVIREDLIGRMPARWPTMLDYRTYAEHDSLWNTPATFSVYLACLVLRWLKRRGGVEAIARVNIEKARMLYDAIDGSGGFYFNRVHPAHRSRMNVVFSLADERLNDAFLREAAGARLVQLKGHRAVGGMRASIYNAMPIEGVRALVEHLSDFKRRHG